MKEVGIDISSQNSDIIDPELLNTVDLEGTAEEKWAVFQRVRDKIGARIQEFAVTGK